jgi:citrate synthase
VAALSTFYPEASRVDDAIVRMEQVVRLIAKVPTIAAFSYRHSRGLPYVYPDNGRSFVENFLAMLFSIGGRTYEPDPALVRALDVLFVLHADHEQNCSCARSARARSTRTPPSPAPRRRSTGRSTAGPTRPSSGCSRRSAP